MLDQLYNFNPWAAYAFSIAVVLAAAELGRLIGGWWGGHHPEANSPNIQILVGAALGLLSLMIGFTFAMTLSRFDVRVSRVVNEANAIGTTALRAGLLPEPHASNVKKLLRDYVQLRLDVIRGPQNAMSLEQVITRSSEIQSALWQDALAVSTAAPNSIPAGLFVQSLNEMIDLQELRLAAARDRVPPIVFFLLYTIAVIGIGLSGYLGGLWRGGNARIPVAITAVMVASVIGVVGDLDRSQGGFITVTQQAMYSLRQSMNR